MFDSRLSSLRQSYHPRAIAAKALALVSSVLSDHSQTTVETLSTLRLTLSSRPHQSLHLTPSSAIITDFNEVDVRDSDYSNSSFALQHAQRDHSLVTATRIRPPGATYHPNHCGSRRVSRRGRCSRTSKRRLSRVFEQDHIPGNAPSASPAVECPDSDNGRTLRCGTTPPALPRPGQAGTPSPSIQRLPASSGGSSKRQHA